MIPAALVPRATSPAVDSIASPATARLSVVHSPTVPAFPSSPYLILPPQHQYLSGTTVAQNNFVRSQPDLGLQPPERAFSPAASSVYSTSSLSLPRVNIGLPTSPRGSVRAARADRGSSVLPPGHPLTRRAVPARSASDANGQMKRSERAARALPTPPQSVPDTTGGPAEASSSSG